METQVSLVHVSSDSTLNVNDVFDLQSAADFLQHISGVAKNALPKKEPIPCIAYRTPFQKFMDILLAEQPSKVTTTGGAAEWSGAPIEAIIAQGLWPIMLKVAEKQRMTLGTETNVLKHIAPKVEQMINIGIMLAYGSPEIAAEEFKKRVLCGIKIDNSKAKSFAEVVQMPVAKFFAQILKVIAPARESLLKNLKKTVERNRAFAHCVYISEDLPLGSFPALSRIHTLAKKMDEHLPHLGYHDSDYDELGSIGDALMAYQTGIALLKKLPVKFMDIHRSGTELSGKFIAINSEWLYTQIVMAANQAPIDEGSISTEQYATMIRHFKTMSVEEILAAVFHRFEQRGVNRSVWNEAEQDILEATILLAIKKIKDYKPEGIHHLILTYYDFTANFQEERNFSHKEALKLATTGNPSLRNQLFNDKAAQAKINASLSWEAIHPNEVIEILACGIIPILDVARGVLRTDRSMKTVTSDSWIIGRTLAEDVRGRPDRTDEAEELLRNNGFLEHEKVQPVKLDYLENPSVIPQEEKPDFILKTLRALQDEFYDSEKLTRFILFVADTDYKFARNFFARADIRQTLYRFLEAELLNKDRRNLNRVSGTECDSFITSIGRQTWIKFKLTAEINMREMDYAGSKQHILENLAEGWHQPWRELESHPDKYARPSFESRVDSKTIAKLVRTKEFSEAGIFRWFHEADPECETKLKKYLRNRDRYFRIVRGK
jgi:hypothetical protein